MSKRGLIALWGAQALLFAVFMATGIMKVVTPIPILAERLPWVAEAPELLVRFIGVSEMLGALGVALPSVTRVAPFLTPLAAAGLTLVMALATAFHLAHGEFVQATVPLLIGALAVFVACGRSAKARIPARKARLHAPA